MISRSNEADNAIDAVLRSAVSEGVFPGAVLAVRLRGEMQCLLAAGSLSAQAPHTPVQASTVYDLASLTKPLATTTSILLLVQEGLLHLQDPLYTLLEELTGSPVGDRTVEELLSHSSGLPGWRPFYEMLHANGAVPGDRVVEAQKRVLQLIRDEVLIYARGEKSLYSDLGFMLLGFVVERVSHLTLDRFAWEKCFRPLGSEPLLFSPVRMRERTDRFGQVVNRAAIAPTEFDPWRGIELQGDVHDQNAAALGGVAGHAGLFGSAEAVLAVSGAWLAAYHQRPSIFAAPLVRQFVARQTRIPHSSWGLGWDTPSAPSSSGSYLSPQSFGHLGYTGTSLWIDPHSELEVVLLSNRVHPTSKNDKIREFRPRVHDVVYREYVGERG